MTYSRPPGHRDFETAREFEETVGTWLGNFRVGHLDSTTKLDWWVPGVFIDVKEKRQPLGQRWHLLDGVAEPDLFVIDELSVRRAAEFFPHSYFLIRDVPAGGRIFLARIDEVFCAERARVNRETSQDRKKGKWIVDLRNFRQLVDPATQLLPTVLHDQSLMPWKLSESLSQKEIRNV